MSVNPFTAAIDLSPRPSMRAFKALFWLHALPLALIPFAVQRGPVMLGLMGMIGLSWLALRRHPALGFGPRAITRLIWRAEGDWMLFDASGAHGEAVLLGSSYVHSALVILRFRLKNGRRRTRVLLGDELDAEPLRRLRARLAIGLDNDTGGHASWKK